MAEKKKKGGDQSLLRFLGFGEARKAGEKLISLEEKRRRAIEEASGANIRQNVQESMRKKKRK